MIYFDNSSTTGFKPECVINAVSNTLRYLSANPGRGSHTLAMRTALLVNKTRENVAKLVGCSSVERVIFGLNCTDALNTAIFGTVQPGGHVVTTACEHNSVLRPLFELQKRGQITLTVLEPGELGFVSPEQILNAIRGETYLVCVNHVSNVTGAVAPITQIGARLRQKFERILFLVDGAQSVGYTDIDMTEMNIDVLSISPHKGLHGIQGVGCLVLSDRVNILPIRFGGTGTASSSTYQPYDLPEALESGTLPTPAIAGLNAAVNWNRQHAAYMRGRLSELSIYALENLRKIPNVSVYTPPNTFNGIISFNVGRLNSGEVSDILCDQYDIGVRSGLHCAPLMHKHLGTLSSGAVRMSLGFENTFAEIDHLINAVIEISKSY